MARVGKMYWVTRLGCFYCKVGGKQVRLSPEKEDARQLYARILAKHGSIRVPTVRDVVAIYLGKVHLEPSTIAKKKRVLDTLIEMYGDLEARELSASDIDLWVDRYYPNVNSTTKRDRIAEPQAAWRFAAETGLIPANRIACVRKPTASQREHFIPKSDWDRYLAACPNRKFRLLVEFGLYTGARAQEAVILTSDDWGGDRFTLPKARAKGRRRGRLIMVPARLRPAIEREIEDHDGIVFRNTRGEPWNKNSLNCSMRRMKEKLGDPELCFTSLRHSFATAKVAAGVPLETVAKLMGHSSTKMVYERYARFAKTDVLANAAEVF